MNSANNAAAMPPESFRVDPWIGVAATQPTAHLIRIDTTGAMPLTWPPTQTFGTATGPLPVIWS